MHEEMQTSPDAGTPDAIRMDKWGSMTTKSAETNGNISYNNFKVSSKIQKKRQHFFTRICVCLGCTTAIYSTIAIILYWSVTEFIQTMDEMKSQIHEIKDVQKNLLKQRMLQAQATERFTIFTTSYGISLTVCILAGVYYIIYSEITLRKQAQAVLQQERDKVLESTKELIAANERLQQQLFERERTQRILQQQAELLNLAHDAIITVNMDNIITFWNCGAEVLYGFSKQDALKQEINTLLQTQFPKPLPEINAEVIQQGCWEGELIQYKQDGTQTVVASRWVVQRDMSSRAIAILKINTDITEHKQAEEALKLAQESLEIKVRERTAQLAAVNEELKAEIIQRQRLEEKLSLANEELEKRVRDRTQEISKANDKLSGWVRELETRNHEIAQLSEISEILQACMSVEEAYTALAELVPAIFTNTSGGVYIITASKNLVEAVATWGNETFVSQKIFAPKECWALRRGRIHRVEFTHRGLQCQHIHLNSRNSESLCVPMMAHGEALGVLHLSSQQQEVITPAKQQLAITVAENIALALANLKLHEAIQQQSIRDSLTGLFNRRYMEESLEREIHRAARAKQSLAIIMLDVDHFKRFNDSFGHDAGDAVLRELGKFLQKQIRASDIACRYGGEELTLILPETSLDVATARAECIREGVKHFCVEHRRQHLGAITVSLGVACFPKHGLTGEAVLTCADTALFKAKKEGRDRVCTITQQ